MLPTLSCCSKSNEIAIWDLSLKPFISETYLIYPMVPVLPILYTRYIYYNIIKFLQWFKNLHYVSSLDNDFFFIQLQCVIKNKWLDVDKVTCYLVAFARTENVYVCVTFLYFVFRICSSRSFYYSLPYNLPSFSIK